MSSSTKSRHKIVWQTNIAGFDIILAQKNRDSFMLQYGKEVALDMPYAEAAYRVGSAIMHASACEGKLDNG